MVQATVHNQRAEHKLGDNYAESRRDLAHKLVDYSEALCVKRLRIFR